MCSCVRKEEDISSVRVSGKEDHPNDPGVSVDVCVDVCGVCVCVRKGTEGKGHGLCVCHPGVSG